jgi:hypothetical protein
VLGGLFVEVTDGGMNGGGIEASAMECIEVGDQSALRRVSLKLQTFCLGDFFEITRDTNYQNTTCIQ